MELAELKQKWNSLDEGLSRTEVYNKKVLMELIKGKTQTMYDRFRKSSVFGLFATAGIAVGLIPLHHSVGIYKHEATFWLLEAVCMMGLLMLVGRMVILSRFDILSSPTGQLRNLIRYKRCLFWDGVIGVSLAVAGIAGALLLEAWASLTGLTLVLLTALIAVFCAWFNWQKHKGMIREVEQSLGELKEFEAA